MLFFLTWLSNFKSSKPFPIFHNCPSWKSLAHERHGKEQQIFKTLYVEFQPCCPKRKEFFFPINNNVFLALSSIIFLLQCKVFVDVLARIADSADPFWIDLLKVIAKYFFQVTHPSSWRMYGSLIVETKMHLISECELSLAFCCLVTSSLEIVRIFLPGLLCDLV